ncbi:MAG TPA: threonine-phosphate decarboxylase CobD [Terriglobales bacterium]|nr:threonine-phosphate decarboxylase CobD [Terriglobales bacterium]
MSPGEHGGDIWGAAKRRGVPLSRWLDFSANINPLGPSRKARQRLARDLSLVAHYPDNQQGELRRLLAARDGIAADCILFGNGATQLIHLLPRVGEYKKALIVEPTFSEYRKALSHSGAEIREFLLPAEDDFHFDLERLLRVLRRERPEVLFLASPNNPTGLTIPHRMLLRVSAFCEERGTDLVVDESFIEFTTELSLTRRATGARRLIVLRSLTKSFALPGLRIGYLVAGRSRVAAWASRMEPWSVNTLALSAAAASILDADYLEKARRLVGREREYLSRGLAQLGWLRPYSTSTNFVLARIRNQSTTAPAVQRMLEARNVLVRDASDFRGLGKDYLRFAVRHHQENSRLLAELRVIGEMLKS